MGEEETKDLANLVNKFGEVFFSLGEFSFREDASVDVVRRTLDEYREAKKGFNCNTLVYDNEINTSLETYEELNSLERV